MIMVVHLECCMSKITLNKLIWLFISDAEGTYVMTMEGNNVDVTVLMSPRYQLTADCLG